MASNATIWNYTGPYESSGLKLASHVFKCYTWIHETKARVLTDGRLIHGWLLQGPFPQKHDNFGNGIPVSSNRPIFVRPKRVQRRCCLELKL